MLESTLSDLVAIPALKSLVSQYQPLAKVRITLRDPVAKAL